MTQPVADAHDRTVRWRQLVDLLSRPHDEIDPALLDAALTMVRTGMRSSPRPIRAATARSIAGRAAEPRLIAIFAGDRLEVAAPLLAAAPLDEAGWTEVMAAASKEVAAFIRTIRGDQAPPAAAQPAHATGSATGGRKSRIRRSAKSRPGSNGSRPSAKSPSPSLCQRRRQEWHAAFSAGNATRRGKSAGSKGAPRGA